MASINQRIHAKIFVQLGHLGGIKSTQYEEKCGILLALINHLSTNFHYWFDRYNLKSPL